MREISVLSYQQAASGLSLLSHTKHGGKQRHNLLDTYLHVRLFETFAMRTDISCTGSLGPRREKTCLRGFQ